ncbi:MAG: hypothetical protein JKY65_01875 [Planctomycetes bacterium]|nr:hypothetical protein [Planctomycetota bacterium]
MHKLFLCLLTILSFVVVGCASSTEEFVDTHYQGFTILRGNVRSVTGLTSSKWQHLTDGIAVEVDSPGCRIVIQQGEGDIAASAQTFTLKARDHIIWSKDGDFVLKALTNAPAPAAAPAPAPAAAPAPAPAIAPAGQ